MDGSLDEDDDFGNIINDVLDLEGSLTDQGHSSMNSFKYGSVGSSLQWPCAIEFDTEKLTNDRLLQPISHQQFLMPPTITPVSDTKLQHNDSINFDPKQSMDSPGITQNLLTSDPRKLTRMHGTQDDVHGHTTMMPSVQHTVMTQMQSGTWHKEQRQLQTLVLEQAVKNSCKVVQSEEKKKKNKSKQPKRLKKYQQTTPLPDKKEENQRINAIKAKQYRDKKKQIEDQLRQEISRLRQENYHLRKLLG